MLRKKSKKALKKIIVRARMKRVQKIMAAIRIHKAIVARQLNKNKKKSRKVGMSISSVGNNMGKLRGRISAVRKRARDLWTKNRVAENTN